jgi:hypothetical protein
MEPCSPSASRTVDSSPKWFTEIQLDSQDYGMKSTIEYVPILRFDDSAFTRVVLAQTTPTFSSSATPAS